MKNLRSCLCELILFPFLLVTLKKAFFLSDAVWLSDLSQVHVGLFTPSWTWSFCHLLLFVPLSKYLSLKTLKCQARPFDISREKSLKPGLQSCWSRKGWIPSGHISFWSSSEYTSVFTTKLFSSSAPDGLGWIVMLFQLLVKMINCSSTLLSGYTDQKARGE